MRQFLLLGILLLLSLGAGPTHGRGGPALQFEGLSLEGEYIYQDGRYLKRIIALPGSLAMAQVDFFPPPQGVWVESEVVPLYGTANERTWLRIEYQGGLAWRHLVLESSAPGWHRWTVKLGPLGGEETDQLNFLVFRSIKAY